MKLTIRGIKEDLRKVIQCGEALGFTMSVANNNHLKFSKRGTKPVFVSRTPSDHHAYKNAQSDLRRAARLCEESA